MITINGDRWRVLMVNSRSRMLIDRTNNLRLATTDPKTMTIYISDELSGSMLTRVLIHEIGHCIMWSYNLFDDIHRMVKRRYWIEAEEWICNFLADYGMIAFNQAAQVIGSRALVNVPRAMSKLVA